jgi:hypothetical protein
MWADQPAEAALERPASGAPIGAVSNIASQTAAAE